LERQLSVAQGKYHDIEDVMLQMERDKGTQERQLEATRKQLEGETSKRAQLEKTVAIHKAELTQLKDRNVQLTAELNQALTDLAAREAEAKQFQTTRIEHTTVVEHVHVLEEAKRVTDRQLAEATDALEREKAHTQSLKKANRRLAGEAEDSAREIERERLELRTKEKTVKAQEEKMSKALTDAERVRKDKDMSELQTRRLQIELQSSQRQIEDLTQQLHQAKRDQDKLDADLNRLVDDTGGTPVSMARRVAQLEGQLIEAKSSRVQSSRYSVDGYNNGGDWRREKERMEAKIAELTKAYEASTAAQAEQRSQIGSLHSQVRDLRGVLDDAEADRMLLQKARRALQSELETIKHVDNSQVPNDREFHKLQLKQLDLERSLEEQEYRASNSLDRLKKAEAYANECQVELGRVKVDNSELDKLNVSSFLLRCAKL
jgi:myosin protein heavy chain